MIAEAQWISDVVDILIAIIGGSFLLGAAYVAARSGAKKGSKGISDKMETGNGSTIGATVQQLSHAQEAAAGLTHEAAQELRTLSDRVGLVGDRLDAHIIEAKPLLEFVKSYREEKR